MSKIIYGLSILLCIEFKNLFVSSSLANVGTKIYITYFREAYIPVAIVNKSRSIKVIIRYNLYDDLLSSIPKDNMYE